MSWRHLAFFSRKLTLARVNSSSVRQLHPKKRRNGWVLEPPWNLSKIWNLSDISSATWKSVAFVTSLQSSEHNSISQKWYTPVMTSWYGHAWLALCEGIRRWSGESIRNGPVMRGVNVFFVVSMNNPLNKQWSCYSFETSWCSDDVTVMVVTPGSLFTKRMDVLPQNSKPRDSGYTLPIALKFDRHLGSSAAEMPVKFQRDAIIMTSTLADSRLHEILWQDARLLSLKGPVKYIIFNG